MNDPLKKSRDGANGQEKTEDSSPTSKKRKGNVKNLTAMGKGRPKGVQNKIPKRAQEAIESAFWEGGGVEWLVSLMHGTASDRAVFANLYGRLLPLQVNSNIEKRVRYELSWLQSRNIGRNITPDDQSVGQSAEALEDQRVVDADFTDVSSRSPIGYPADGGES